MKPKTYILQKDLPNVKAGTEFVWWPEGGIYKYAKDNDDNKRGGFNKSYVEDNIPEWFKLKEEERLISRHCFNMHFMGMDVIKINDVEYINKKDAEAAVFEYINNKMPHGQ